MAYANRADLDQTAPDWSGSLLFAISLSILWNNCIKKQNSGKKGME